MGVRHRSILDRRRLFIREVTKKISDLFTILYGEVGMTTDVMHCTKIDNTTAMIVINPECGGTKLKGKWHYEGWVHRIARILEKNVVRAADCAYQGYKYWYIPSIHTHPLISRLLLLPLNQHLAWRLKIQRNVLYYHYHHLIRPCCPRIHLCRSYGS